MSAEYEFMIGIQSLKGLPDDGAYCIAWKKGAEAGATARKASSGGTADFAEAVRVRETVPDTSAGAKDLFELHVHRHDGGKKETMGMLYMDLSMHVPKGGKQGVKQAACLQLSNCVHPTVRLSLTVQCFGAGGGSQPLPLPSLTDASRTERSVTVGAHANGGGARVEGELRDEIARLRRENERLKSEDSYSFTNNPVRQKVPDVRMLEEQVAILRQDLERTATDLSLAHQKAATDAQVHEDTVRALELQHMRDINDVKLASETMKAAHAEEVRQCKLELSAALQRSADVHLSQGGAQAREIEDLRLLLKQQEEERDALRRQVAALTANTSKMQTLRDDDERDKREMSLLCEALESQKKCMGDRLKQLETDYQDLQRSSAEERAATEEAKHMLSELMNRIREAQTTEEALQGQLRTADEEKAALIEQLTLLNKTVTALHTEMHTARDEEKARAHATIADLQTELAVEKKTKDEQIGMNKQQIDVLRAQREELTATVDQQGMRIAQKKKRIADLKRILGLHLKMKQAHSLAFGDGPSGVDADALAALTSVQSMVSASAP